MKFGRNSTTEKSEINYSIHYLSQSSSSVNVSFNGGFSRHKDE
jgi:hypothetical protein